MMTRKTRQFKTTVEYKGQKYVLEGEHHQRHSSSMGQIEIHTINGNRSTQILPGMPEIHYTYTDSHPFYLPEKINKATFTDKVDGTAILFSPLNLGDGNTAVFARTRGMLPIRDTKWRPLESLLNEALTPEILHGIERACITQKATLVFELYGNKNRHTVNYVFPTIALKLHTVIKGKNTVQPWTVLKQIAKSNKIPTVDELLTLKSPLLTEEAILDYGNLITTRQESYNLITAGEYCHEGVIVNIETPTTGYQWKFKPASMEEFHRVARTSICPITVAHTLWKMVDDEIFPSLDNLVDVMTKDYDRDAVHSQSAMIEHEYWAWMSQEEQYFAFVD